MSARSAYGPLDRALHRLVLGNKMIAETLFDLNLSLAKANADAVRQERHVFVAGLARAGTTILLHRLHQSGTFRSLTYSDMPFVLAPTLGAPMSRRKTAGDAPSERAHGDGILVDAASPEAFDEAYWRVFDGSAYIRKDRLTPHDPDEDTCEGFARYVAAILKTATPTRYLSKNNNNILRLPAIARTFPNALIIVPFREPKAHATSLWRQHTRFVRVQGEDPFVLDYMNMLSHHEFGRGHKPFRADASSPLPPGDPSQLNYWYHLWCDVMEWLLTHAPSSARFIGHEALCRDEDVWLRIAEDALIDPVAPGSEPFRASSAPIEIASDPAVVARSEALHGALVERGSDR